MDCGENPDRQVRLPAVKSDMETMATVQTVCWKLNKENPYIVYYPVAGPDNTWAIGSVTQDYLNRVNPPITREELIDEIINRAVSGVTHKEKNNDPR